MNIVANAAHHAKWEVDPLTTATAVPSDFLTTASAALPSPSAEAEEPGDVEDSPVVWQPYVLTPLDACNALVK